MILPLLLPLILFFLGSGTKATAEPEEKDTQRVIKKRNATKSNAIVYFESAAARLVACKPSLPHPLLKKMLNFVPRLTIDEN